MKRRLLGGCVVLSGALALIACGGGDDAEATPAASAGSAGAATAGKGGTTGAGAGGTAAGTGGTAQGGEGGEGGEGGSTAGGSGGATGGSGGTTAGGSGGTTAGGSGGATGGSGGTPAGGSGGSGVGGAAGVGGSFLWDTGFRPAKDGFAFENYGNEDKPTNLTADEMVKLFGTKVCGSNAGGTCTLTPPAQQWMDKQNEGMNGGHCEGMAVLSILIQHGDKKISDFGAPMTSDLTRTPPVTREIAQWFSTQATFPARETEWGKMNTPVEVEDKLLLEWKAGTDTYSIGIYKPDGSGGHAVSPYAIVDLGGGKHYIMVYDNNYPNEERFIAIDRNAKTWEYTGSTKPTEPAASYKGDATSGSLTIAPSKPRMQQQQCHFCSDDSVPTGTMLLAAPLQTNEISFVGTGDMLVTMADGKRIGHTGGMFVNEVPMSTVSRPRSNPALANDNPEPELYVPATQAFTVTIDGAGTSSASDLTVVGKGFTLSVEGINVEAMQKDTIFCAADGSEITYETAGSETPVVVLGYEDPGADYGFAVTATGDANGVRVGLKADRATGKLAIKLQDATGFAIAIERIDAAGEQVFYHAGNTLGSNDTAYLSYGMWPGNGMSLQMEIDADSDGTIDSTVMLSDDGN